MVGNALPWHAPGKGSFPETGSIPLPPVHDEGRWLIALDLDGTTVDADNRASAAVQRAIDMAQAAGHVVMIATGRPIQGVTGIYRELGLTAEYSVCSNGALVCGMREPTGQAAQGIRTRAVDDSGVEPHEECTGHWRVVDMTLFDPAPVIDALVPSLPDAKYAVEDADQGWRFFRPFNAGTFSAPAELVSLDDLRSHPVTRVVVFSPAHDTAEFQRIVEGIGLHQVSYSVGWSAWLDIAPFGVNKGTALEKVRRRLGIPRNRVAVVGDGLNDIEMITWAAEEGIGAAMGHALPEVRAMANRVVADLDGDGVADLIHSIVG
ncbi:HAD hydrolase family protein [Pseudoclavibacter sp. CFCC 13611]|uniref:HAD hydrolase family protein n=1 Tax=Pseudoclavibacter sp. CFCC 13611 TaxID=2615178 RepID=UPI0013019A12|nr:HAD hydrolase family protein [Pseudoclavibacter sp. CFCC 13611]KAB1662916.1 HAD hydrolase family protein [Pseudoclavibacter sp. CFCC 13611]